METITSGKLAFEQLTIFVEFGLNLELLLIKISKCLRDTLRLVNTRKAWDHPITTEQGEMLSE